LLPLCLLKVAQAGLNRSLSGLAAMYLVCWIVGLVITTPHVGRGLRPITGPSSAEPITSP
jgi:hypothetical protein